MKLTEPQAATLRDIRDGKVTRSSHWRVWGARADVLGRLEESFDPPLAYCDWDDPANLKSRSPAHRQKFKVKITDAGQKALREDWERIKAEEQR